MSNPMDYGFRFMFALTPILSLLIFGLAFGTIIGSLVRSAKQRSRDNNSPRLTVDAKIVAKRSDVHRHRHSTAGDIHHHHYSTSTTYYVTFQVQSGDRMELQLEGREYGLLIEGDEGKLTFQGSRFLGFERR